ncbi:zinc finger MYM-type protein 5-like [Protopterus annectens]|uniref:zinc finger MYM-type protein 5-like n=1 Tax=Protopterus annectens TaxID=7888 RepID=UPI001CFA7E1A|nr:zinc finger MYM-type protein 5-like [Protopterus annectens]
MRFMQSSQTLDSSQWQDSEMLQEADFPEVPSSPSRPGESDSSCQSPSDACCMVDVENTGTGCADNESESEVCDNGSDLAGGNAECDRVWSSVSGASIDSIPVWSELGAAHLSDQLDVCEAESKEADPVTHREVYSDPGKWPDPMDDKVRCLLSAVGPVQIMNHSFPYDDHHRRFNPIFYNKRLTNGETVRRSWLVYSESSDLVFCFCCKLFSSTHLVALSSTGTCDWKNLGQKLIEHERSVKHKEAAAKWSDLHLRLKNSSTIDHHRENMIESERKYWRNVLERLLAICQYLSPT